MIMPLRDGSARAMLPESKSEVRVREGESLRGGSLNIFLLDYRVIASIIIIVSTRFDWHVLF